MAKDDVMPVKRTNPLTTPGAVPGAVDNVDQDASRSGIDGEAKNDAKSEMPT